MIDRLNKRRLSFLQGDRSIIQRQIAQTSVKIVANQNLFESMRQQRLKEMNALTEDVIETKEVVRIMIDQRIIDRVIDGVPETIVHGDVIDFQEDLLVRFHVQSAIGQLNGQNMRLALLVSGDQFDQFAL